MVSSHSATSRGRYRTLLPSFRYFGPLPADRHFFNVTTAIDSLSANSSVVSSEIKSSGTVVKHPRQYLSEDILRDRELRYAKGGLLH